MMGFVGEVRVHDRLVDSLYIEAMLLADEARSYFDEDGRLERDLLSPITRVSFSCESLKVTTRLMHVIAWLLTQRAVIAGELSQVQALESSRRLGDAPATTPEVLATLPDPARALIGASIELHRRVARLDTAQDGVRSVASPARDMLTRLAASF